MFVYQLYVFGKSVKNALQYPRKIYLIDTGIRRAITTRYSQSFGNLFENAVFLYLLRNIDIQERLAYWRSPRGYEVDFLVEKLGHVTKLIQVAYEIDEITKQREEHALLAAMKELGVSRGIIITWDFEGETHGGKIIYIPLWKLLIKEPEIATKHAFL